VVGITGSLAFVSDSEKEMKVKKLNVLINNSDDYLFLSEKDVKDFLNERKEALLSRQYSKINIPHLEKVLNSHPVIENAEVAKDISGEIKIEITQRSPVCRIINSDGESYYIDTQNKLMPLSDNYAARVLVVNGFINEPYATRYQFSVDQIAKNPLLKDLSVLDEVMQVVNYVHADSTLNLLIQQVYVNKEKELELFPSIGNHRIIFGGTELLSEKFNKLKLFYTEGLNKSDSWNKYSTINLKYKNLVVCTKK
jgi:cell division protein FtsQ